MNVLRDAFKKLEFCSRLMYKERSFQATGAV